MNLIYELFDIYKDYVKECFKINCIAFILEFTVETIKELIKTNE